MNTTNTRESDIARAKEETIISKFVSGLMSADNYKFKHSCTDAHLMAEIDMGRVEKVVIDGLVFVRKP